MMLHVVTLLLFLHLMAATTSQFMPPPLPYPYPPGGPMMQMPHSQQMMQMPPGAQMMQMPPGAQMMPMPPGGHMQPAMMPHLPRLPGMPGPGQMPFPMSLPMHNGGRLPMVVMPRYTKKADKSRKKKGRGHKPKRKRINMESSSSEASCSESVEYRAKNSLRSSSKKKRHEVLTPVVSYVTKEGYVIYQKKIKKDKAKDWLELTKGESGEYDEKIGLKKREQ